LRTESYAHALVTGGAGFIGSHLVEQLLLSGINVTVLDDFSTGTRRNLESVDSSRLTIIEGSVQNRAEVAMATSGCDIVFHLAARADIVPSITSPMEYFDTNVTGTANVVNAARDFAVKKIVYAASSSCYGLPENVPTKETERMSPQYPYALTKWLGEEVVRHWGSVYKIPWASLRLFNVYGLRSRTSGTYGAVLGVFLAQKLNGKSLTVVGDGLQSRDFTHVSDVARAFIAVAMSGVQGDVFNVGSGSSQTIRDLAELIGGPTVNVPERPGEPRQTLADIEKIRRVLGWKPEIDFHAGVKEVLSNIDRWTDAPVWDPESIGRATKDWFKYLADGPGQGSKS